MSYPIYIIKTTKAHAKTGICKLLRDILGPDAIDRILSIDGVESNLRVFVVVLWRVPLVSQFHNEYTEPGDILHGNKLPWILEKLEPYGIFADGHFPAPHFLRNSHNLTDTELTELGIGGPGEFIYVQLPTNEGIEFHWQMYRSGTYYMPDMSYYNRPHIEPLTVVNSPRIDASIPSRVVTKVSELTDFTRWRDFYIEYPKTWPKDLTEEERAYLEETYALIVHKSPWSPHCGRDPTNMAEEQIRLEALKQTIPTHDSWMADIPESELTIDDLPRCGLSRSFSVASPPDVPQRESSWSPYPAQVRSYITEDCRYMEGQYKWSFRQFD